MFDRKWSLLGVPALLVIGCAAEEPATEDKIDQPLVLTGAKVDFEGVLNFDTVVFAENPTTLLERDDLHSYEFEGKAGGVVTISMASITCGAPDTFVYLFGPENEEGDRGVDLIHNDDAFEGNCSLDSKIKSFTLPVDGEYLIIASSFLTRGGGHYSIVVSCDNGACEPDDAHTFAKTRVSQRDVDAGLFSPEDLFEVGDFMFETIYRVQDGMGNALIGGPAGSNPPPNFRGVHFAGFGAPEAQSCITCHNIGGDDGAGDLNHNIFQIGDGINQASGVQRNPPTVLGNGLRQRVGEEMSAELKAELAFAKQAAAAQGTPVTQALTAKGIAFGSVIANPDGTTDTTGIQGVDTDLVVKPFGWKGRESLLRRFVEGGFRVHFGMQSQPSVIKNCPTPQMCNVNNFGNGQVPLDPDGDGFQEEITEGQLTAMAIYMGLRETPIRVPPTSSDDQAQAAAGEQLFLSVGCATCHTASLKINVPLHIEPADTTGGGGIQINLATDNHEPRPAVENDGSMTVEAFSDYKRHDMGADLADSKDFNQIKANQFITTPLWGVATSAPYLHDGRAPTLSDAILKHGGEAQAVRDAFAALSADDQGKVVAFLGTLSRVENLAPPVPETVDLSGFRVSQTGASFSFTLPANTRVQHGGFLVISRNATQAQFESFYGRALGSNVVFINSGSKFPSINGSEAFTLRDALGAVVDGPSAAMRSSGKQNFQRKSGALPAGSSSSWTITTVTTAGATPGSGIASTGNGRVFISEFSDTAGPGTFLNEFVEIFVE